MPEFVGEGREKPLKLFSEVLEARCEAALGALHHEVEDAVDKALGMFVAASLFSLNLCRALFGVFPVALAALRHVEL